MAMRGAALKNDRIFVMAVVEQNGNSLWQASPLLRNDRDIVLTILQNNGRRLR
jgi:hypothetical protein